ncbi:MAG TPA: DNA topoisomerase IB [Jatrophihabitans sp.]|nr:DNA topoisomerase IB [Jatrophihabitans sp.]
MPAATKTAAKKGTSGSNGRARSSRRKEPKLTVAELDELYASVERCAEVAGLVYITGEEPGLRRVRQGKGFSYRDVRGQALSDAAVKARIAQLAVPPAWRKVWICPDPDGHILATGEDDRGRKQYIYHPRWRSIRDLLNFYRLLLFAEQLSTIRAYTGKQLNRRTLDRERVIAAMIRIIDDSYLRIGNESYAEENDSYGLTTLTRKHVRVSGDRIEFEFPAKSGRTAQVSMTDRKVARIVAALAEQRASRLFTVDGKPIDSDEVNRVLLEVTGEHITAKNFRTWGGTLAAFEYLEDRLNSERAAATERAVAREVVAAVDEAAETLGNTRSVARAHYVHPHVLETYTEHTFGTYLDRSRPLDLAGLEPSEQRLAGFLTELFASEFSLLQT